MNEYKVKVSFEMEQIITDLKQLVQNDYNTTKLNFTFDKEGRVLFKILYPDGTQYVDEIQNNELIFGKGVLNQEGTYEYEVSLYSEDGRLTDYAVKSFEVRSELVDTDKLVEPDDRVPVLDSLINEVNTIKQDIEDGKYNTGGTSDYNELTNKPLINNVELLGNKTLEELGIQPKGNYLTEYNETDPTVPSYVKNITEEDISNWNTKFSGNYNDLTNKPTIPTKTSELENNSGFITSIPSEYVTETELNNKGYLTSIPQGYATEEFVNNAINNAIGVVLGGSY